MNGVQWIRETNKLIIKITDQKLVGGHIISFKGVSQGRIKVERSVHFPINVYLS